MSQSDPNRPTSAASDARVDSAPAASVYQGHAKSVAAYLLAALIVGTLAGVLLGQFSAVFKLPVGMVPSGAQAMSMMGDQKKAAEVRAGIAQMQHKNNVFAAALTGLVLACGFGFTEGLIGKSPKSMLIGAVVGTLAGAVLGAAGGVLMQWTGERMTLAGVSDVMYRTLAMHLVLFGCVGLAAGLATGAAASNWRVLWRILPVAAAGGLLGAVLNLPAGLLLTFVSSTNPDQAIPAGTANQLCWALAAALAIGLLIGIARQSRPV
ncbi:MAG: hypothetical protein EXS05_17870 [Planctomycetaceae bacterium]|nr:hypothetical protein [Planctomycetaceae bacterium]